MQLLIVESPNKCAKIQGLLDARFGVRNWIVAASVGHIRDLPLKTLGIDRQQNYKATYEISEGKSSVVNKLKKLVTEAGQPNVYLATDPDREGESIAFHLAMVLGLSLKTAKRVTFYEITDRAIAEAFSKVRTIDARLVAAQEARRTIDRLAGYEVSSVVSRKLGDRLSAGRVQSVALRLVVERERSINAFMDSADFRIRTTFNTAKGESFGATKTKLFTKATEALNYLQTVSPKKWRVTDVEQKPVTRPAPPPYITSTLQQDAIRKLSKGTAKWTAKAVMDVAQKLFEQGHITYMRTDSPNLSAEAVGEIKQVITKMFGPTYFKANSFTAKASAQEAHEAIRPTRVEVSQAGETEVERQLYTLIYRRALASQMAPARYDQTLLTVNANPTPSPDDEHRAKTSILVFDGYRRLYQEEEETADEEEPAASLTGIAVGEILTLQQMVAKQTYQQPPKRYDEASLVGKLEREGIGRPSTYASILAGISKRAYVETRTISPRPVTAQFIRWEKGQISQGTEKVSIGGDKNKLCPCSIGLTVTDYLEKNFGVLVDHRFTAQMENQLDDITLGNNSYVGVVSNFDTQHSRMLSQAESERVDAPRKTSTRMLGDWNGSPVRAGTGPKGDAYLLYRHVFYPVAGKSAGELTLGDLEPAIEAKKQQQAQQQVSIRRAFSTGKITYQIRDGQFGLYVTDGTRKAPLKKISSQEQIDALTAADCALHLKSYEEWKKSGGNRHPTTAQKSKKGGSGRGAK